ncbi:MAG TPA: hypothetical protein VNS80_04320 [Pseudolysinimonas sp.]|nr:hypothetical protein [Pseudolysinimonas sp.]
MGARQPGGFPSKAANAPGATKQCRGGYYAEHTRDHASTLLACADHKELTPMSIDPATATGITHQLRRYELFSDQLEDFVEWWTSRLAPARRASGFTIEFAYVDRTNSEFTWSMSVPGDQTAFDATEEEYMQSPARAEAFHETPKRIAKSYISTPARVA